MKGGGVIFGVDQLEESISKTESASREMKTVSSEYSENIGKDNCDFENTDLLSFLGVNPPSLIMLFKNHWGYIVFLDCCKAYS